MVLYEVGIFGAKLACDLTPDVVVRIVETVDGLKSWFSLSEKCTLQILFDQSHIPARDPIWKFEASGFKAPHPISKAIVNYSKEKNISLVENKNFEIIN